MYWLLPAVLGPVLFTILWIWFGFKTAVILAVVIILAASFIEKMRGKGEHTVWHFLSYARSIASERRYIFSPEFAELDDSDYKKELVNRVYRFDRGVFVCLVMLVLCGLWADSYLFTDLAIVLTCLTFLKLKAILKKSREDGIYGEKADKDEKGEDEVKSEGQAAFEDAAAARSGTVETEAGAEDLPEAETEAAAEPEKEPEVETEMEVKPVEGPEAETPAETGTGAAAEPEVKAEAETPVEKEAEPEAETKDAGKGASEAEDGKEK